MPDTDLGERSLSICIPTHHGRARTLTETLDSVARQADTVPGWTLYRGADAVQANLGLSWAYTGCHILRRDRLTEVLAQEGEAALDHTDWPQVYLLGCLARLHPMWVWYPLSLVKARSHNSYLYWFSASACAWFGARRVVARRWRS